MKKIIKIFAVALLFVTFTGVETHSKTASIVNSIVAIDMTCSVSMIDMENSIIPMEPYCASSYNACGWNSRCGYDVDAWIAIWEISNWWCS